MLCGWAARWEWWVLLAVGGATRSRRAAVISGNWREIAPLTLVSEGWVSPELGVAGVVAWLLGVARVVRVPGGLRSVPIGP